MFWPPRVFLAAKLQALWWEPSSLCSFFFYCCCAACVAAERGAKSRRFLLQQLEAAVQEAVHALKEVLVATTLLLGQRVQVQGPQG